MIFVIKFDKKTVYSRENHRPSARFAAIMMQPASDFHSVACFLILNFIKKKCGVQVRILWSVILL